ncbi:MAG: peroxidase family protein [Gammaproteobacteria bacterium]|nr:peroxidase family protein [Gammaproteobacteria bacterium]
MNNYYRVALSLFVTTGLLSACTESGKPSADPSTAEQSESATPIATRSPQGIRGNAGERREEVRRPRREGRFPETIFQFDREIRSYDGTGNNLDDREMGATFTPLLRIAAADYGDGISTLAGTNRPSARYVSNTVVSQQEGESLTNEYGVSHFGWQWGQFIDHDIDLTDGSSSEPAAIPVPLGDRYFDPTGSGTAEIAFNRAIYDPNSGTGTANPREQENEITGWIDGSMVYGSTLERAAALAEGGDSPFLKTSGNDLLPLNTGNWTNANGPIPDPTTLFLAGDVRANEQVGLTVMHTLFVREHNRLVRELQRRVQDASATQLFELARKLVVAKIQMITYNEYLPALVGPNALPAYAGYDASIDSRIMNEFSAAAFRLGHSMVPDQLLRLDADGSTARGGHLDLAAAFFTAPRLLRERNDVDPILRGLAAQPHQKIDVKVIHTLRNLLFGRPGSGGLDLTALNIQRGRDHGLSSYNDTREAFGLSRVTNFAQITDDIALSQSLADTYGDVNNIDLWVGGLAEQPLAEQGSQLGELLHTIVVRQFAALRDGDRFWYEHYLTPEERELVNGTTLAEVIRDNTAIGQELQPNVFRVPR